MNILALSAWEEFSLVFTEIGWFPAVCLILGMIFIIVEIFQPGFGFFGIAGGILVAIGIFARMYKSGAGNPIIQMFILIGVVAVVLGLALLIMLYSMKKGWLSRTAFVDKSRAVSLGHTLGTEDFGDLVGKEGVTLCALRPSGKARIDGRDYDVVASSAFVEKDVPVTVEYTEGVKIVVSPILVTDNNNAAQTADEAAQSGTEEI